MTLRLLRSGARDLAARIEAHCPEGRARALALTNLEQATLWAVEAVSKDLR